MLFEEDFGFDYLGHGTMKHTIECIYPLEQNACGAGHPFEE